MTKGTQVFRVYAKVPKMNMEEPTYTYIFVSVHLLRKCNKFVFKA